MMHWFDSLRWLWGWIRTDCPLCLGPSAQGQLCPGCLDDTFYARQRRAVCVGCAADLAVQKGNARALQTSQARAVAPVRCRRCLRQGSAHDAIVYAFDAGFPADLMLARFSGPRTNLSLAPVIARLMWQALDIQLNHRIEAPTLWLPLPVSIRRLEACQCSPTYELARSLGRLTGRPSCDDVLVRYEAVGHEDCSGPAVRFEVQQNLMQQRVGLVLDRPEAGETIERVCSALRVAGAQHIVVLGAARKDSVWHNHGHVPCDPG